jgi:type I restriction enzyme S subunit
MASRPPAGWRPTKLAAVSDLLAGFAFKSKEFSDGPEDIRLLRGDNIGQGCLRWNSARRWPADRAAEVTRYALAPDDVVLAMDRPWIEAGLKFARVLPSDLPALLVQRVCRLRGHSKALDQRYLAAIIGSPTFERYVQLVTTGSAVPHISGSDIAQFAFDLPPLSEQASIVAVLGALDDKIESNGWVAAGLAAAIAAAWGRSTAQGASTVSLDEVAECVRVPGSPGDNYIGLDDMPRGSTVLREWKTPDQAPKGGSWAFEPGDILFGKLRPYFKKVGVAPIAGRCTREILVLRPRAPNDYGVVLGALTSDAFIDHCVAVSSGTRMPRSEWRDAARFAVPAIDEHRRRELEELARCNYSLVSSFTLESRRVAVIRGALLPRLVSGRIRVPLTNDLDEAVETVLDAV